MRSHRFNSLLLVTGFALSAGMVLGQTSISPSALGTLDPTQANSLDLNGVYSQQQQYGSMGLRGGLLGSLGVNSDTLGTGSSSSPYTDSGGFTQTTDAARQRQEYQQQQRNQKPDPPTDLQRLVQQSTGQMLPIFGQSLFTQAVTTFAPADQVAASPDYILGPGDEVIVRIWGHNNFNGRLTVDRTGAIYIPQVGSVNVAGLRFSDLQEHLRQELNRTYRNFELSVNLGKLRSIQVFVVGEARYPGTYTVSSLATVFNALIASGGPTSQGSMRSIQLRRGTETHTLDLYDFVLSGDRSKDITLQAGDVIFIPFTGPQVAVAGSVRHPAIYEILPSTTAGDVLKLAGGISTTASDARVQLERIEDHHERRAMSLQLDTMGKATPLIDGDVLHIDPVLAGYRDSVTIRGNLANPGRFPWHPGMKLSEIIPDQESLLTVDYWNARNRLGLPTPLFTPLPQTRQVTTNGQAQGIRGPVSQFATDAPGGYSTAQGEAAGVPTGVVDASGASVVEGAAALNNADAPRASVEQRNRLQSADTESNTSSIAEQQFTGAQNLQVSGRRIQVKVAVPEIDWSYAVIERMDRKTLRNSLVPFDLGRLVRDHDTTQDYELQPGDVITIVSQSDISVRQDERTKYVRLEGEFINSGVYSVAPGETLADLVRKAGGPTDKAYLYGSSFTRETARVQQQQRMDEYVSQLSLQVSRNSATRSLSATTALGATGELAEERSMLEQMRRMRATGRIVLEFVPESHGIEAIPALPLEDGDVFRIPSQPATVSVVGAVHGQNVFLFNGKRHVRDYLALAGRPTRIADRKRSFIIRADGSVLGEEQHGGLWNDRFDSALLNPGDTIVVPEKPVKPNALRDIIDYSQIFSQFALGVAAVQLLQ